MPSSFAPGFVKICGVTSVEDAAFAVKAGASAIGLILAESSRQLTLEQARTIADATKGELLRFAVFRGQDDDFIVEHVDELGIDVVQLHGDASKDLLHSLRVLQVQIVKALSIDELAFSNFDETSVDAVLIDSPQPGSGVTYSLKSLQDRNFRVPVIAAGGMTPTNVADVIASTTVAGVDSSTGVERQPGEKDHQLIESFIVNARAAFASRGS